MDGELSQHGTREVIAGSGIYLFQGQHEYLKQIAGAGQAP